MCPDHCQCGRFPSCRPIDVLLASLRAVPLVDPAAHAGIFVAFLGIPHALILLLPKAGAAGAGPAAFIVVYVGLAIAVIALWILFPVVSLVVFLLISAWHFGADWSPNIVVRCGMGMIILGLPALAFGEETATIFRLLSGADAMPVQLWLMVLGVGRAYSDLFFSCYMVGPAIYTAKHDRLSQYSWGFSPLVYFIVYFCALQSNARGAPVRLADRRTAVVWAIGLTIVNLCSQRSSHHALCVCRCRSVTVVFVGLRF